MRLFDTPTLWSRLLTLFALVAAVLVVVNMFLFVANQKLNREVSERQQFIVQTAQIQGIAKDLVTALANLAGLPQPPNAIAVAKNSGLPSVIPSGCFT